MLLYSNYNSNERENLKLYVILLCQMLTINPNMPLRDLFYVSTVLKGRVKDENLYGKVLIKIPAAKDKLSL